jgi:glycosyltransferase involved in cell wall biosynthesis
MKTNIIWMIDSLGHGGAERLTLAILERFDRGRFDLRVCALQERGGNPVAKDLEKAGIPVDLLNIPNLRHPANLFKMTTYLRRHKPQILHTQLEFSIILGSLAARLMGIPCVSTLHTLDNPQEQRARWRYHLTLAALKYLCNRSIGVSESTRQHHLRDGKIPDDKIITLYNGIDLSAYKEPKAESRLEKRKELGLAPDSVVAVTVAVLREPKGIQFMLQAMAQLRETNPNLQYLVVGDGEHGPVLKEMARHLGLENRVVFAGQRKDIPEILPVCDFFVLPTLTEALPTVLMEAMAAQKAIIASNVGGIPEMIQDGLNGRLLPPGDVRALAAACAQLADDSALRNAWGTAGQAICREKFNIEQQIASLENLYNSLIGTRQS